MRTEIKICGLSDPEGVDAALEAGADLLGFVFFPPSPRNVALSQAAALAARARGRAGIVALTVDASDAALREIVGMLRPDLLQLHGKESARRAADIRALTHVPVMKAFGVSVAEDLLEYSNYAVDRFLVDSRPPRGAKRPGGNGMPFDWSLLEGFEPPEPWFLSGGLTPETVGAGIVAVRPPGVDVSSGVEKAPGKKDPELIHAFVASVRAADRPARRMTG